MWAGLRKSTRNAGAPRHQQQEKAIVSVIGAHSPRGVPAGQESVFRDATTTRAETPKQDESGEEIL